MNKVEILQLLLPMNKVQILLLLLIVVLVAVVRFVLCSNDDSGAMCGF